MKGTREHYRSTLAAYLKARRSELLQKVSRSSPPRQANETEVAALTEWVAYLESIMEAREPA